MKLRIYCDSGANIHSKWEDVYDLEDLGMTEEEWKEMSEQDREALVKPIALDRLDWGWEEIP